MKNLELFTGKIIGIKEYIKNNKTFTYGKLLVETDERNLYIDMNVDKINNVLNREGEEFLNVNDIITVNGIITVKDAINSLGIPLYDKDNKPLKNYKFVYIDSFEIVKRHEEKEPTFIR